MSSSAAKLVGARVLYWAPVWLPALVAAQLVTRGLAAELDEDRRLQQQEALMQERVDEHQALRQRLEDDQRKLEDPIYRERVRRSLEITGAKPLTLAQRYVGSLAPQTDE